MDGKHRSVRKHWVDGKHRPDGIDRRHWKTLDCHWAHGSDGRARCKFYGYRSYGKRRVWI